MSEILTMTGAVKVVGETEEVGKNNFKKRLMVIEVEDGEYTNCYGFEVLGDKVNLFDGIAEGETVEVCYNLPRVREWSGKWFPNHLSAWKVKATSASPNTANDAQAANTGGSGASAMDDELPMGDDDLVPF